MGELDLNLSTRPFSSYRVANAGLIAGFVLLVVISVWQAYGYVHYSRLSGSIRGDVRNAQVESESLRRQLSGLDSKLDRPETAAKISEVGFFNNLIVRKNFSWTRIFAKLERLMPESVHLISIHPEVKPDSSVVLHIEVAGHTISDIVELIEALQRSPSFGKVDVAYEETAKKEITTIATDVNAAMTVAYYPDKDSE